VAVPATAPTPPPHRLAASSTTCCPALQHGVPPETYVQKFTNLKFEPAGLTDDPDVRMAQSIMDYIFRRLALDHLSFDERSALGIYSAEERSRQLDTGSYDAPVEMPEAESLTAVDPIAKKVEAGSPPGTSRMASSLGQWVIAQRQGHRIGELNADREVRRLTALPGWDFDGQPTLPIDIA
jgi:hypothetical protein